MALLMAAGFLAGFLAALVAAVTPLATPASCPSHPKHMSPNDWVALSAMMVWIYPSTPSKSLRLQSSASRTVNLLQAWTIVIFIGWLMAVLRTRSG